jgi:hypothetical protein
MPSLQNHGSVAAAAAASPSPVISQPQQQQIPVQMSTIETMFSSLQQLIQQQQQPAGGPVRGGCGGNIGGNEGRKRRPLWKLVRTRNAPSISFRLCSRCSNSLYRNPYKAVEMEGGCAQISFVLCPICVDRNMIISDTLAGYGENRQPMMQQQQQQQQQQANLSSEMMPMGEENGMENA